MGMPIGIDVRDPGVPEQALDRAFAFLRAVDATFSTYRDGSEISRLNRGELALQDAGADVRAVLARCEELRAETDGYFDAHAPLPGGIDPSGLVKGWSVDRVAELLLAEGARNFAVNAGGDVRVVGAPRAGEGWRVGIQHPRRRDRVAAVLEATELAVATSGAYERGEHVVDPHTGRPPAGVLAVTIVGPELATADAYATATYAMGTDGPAWTARLRGYEALTILADDTVLSTPGLARWRQS
jgi:thiamine biosynthesis lipoprotein